MSEKQTPNPDALAAEQPQPVSGWRMVPVEPTQVMLAAGVAAESHAPTHVQERLTLLAYRAMLAAAPQPEAQPVAWMLRSVRGDAFHAGSTPPQPVDVFPWVPLYAAPQPAATPCPHIRSSGVGDHATHWCALNGPPAAPEPSEAEVAAAMASLYRAMEPAAWPSEDEITDALRAAAAARTKC